ncbi:MAG TPA: MBG domain-containing protein, partial [Methylomirabilota bacterium]|nr:MBG domain-containing protein [Methylomirabilota bacterium]
GTLIITANSESRIYGVTNPVFTGTVVGVANGDDISATYDSVATVDSTVGTYAIVSTLVDTNGRASNYDVTLINGTLTVTDDDAPVITLTQFPGYYTVGTTALLIDTNATVSDGGSLNFGGGTLTVTIVTNGADEDLLLVEPNLEINGDGSSVSLSGTVFGTYTGGEGTNALVFTFNTNATPAIVQALARSLTFESDGTNTTSRVLEFVLTDGDDGTSASAFRVLELNRPPVAVEDYITVSDGVAATIPFSLLMGNDYDVDGDAIGISGFSAVSANGGRVTLSGSNFVYRAPTNIISEDLFAYVIDDGRGGEGIGILNIRVLRNNQMEIDVSKMSTEGVKIIMGGTPGRAYEIQASEDLVTWATLTTVTASPLGVIEALDAEATNYSKRFYRAVAP